MASKRFLGVDARSKPRDESEITGLGLGVKKTDRAALCSSDKKGYYKVRDAAIEGMSSKFTLLKGIDEKATMDHLESVYSVITRFEDLKTQITANDTIDVFTIPSEFVTNTDGDLEPSAASEALDLFTQANRIPLQTVQEANAFYLEFGEDYHGENIVWSGQKILNSCDTELRDKLIESTRSWPKKHRGGPTYLKLLLGLILSTSQKSLRSLTDKVQILRITDFPGENATKAVSFIRGAVLILSNNDAAPTDLVPLVLRIFSSSTCTKFKTHVDNIDFMLELGQLPNYTLDTILSNIDKKYIELVSRNEWSPLTASPQQSSSFLSGNPSAIRKIICFNCGGVGHPVPECPKPKDDVMIELWKSIMAEYGGKAKPSSSPSNGKSNPLLIPPKKGEPHKKLIDGVLMKWCGKRGCRCWNPDHSTKEHPPTTSSDSPAANAAAPSPSPGTTMVDPSASEGTAPTSPPSNIGTASMNNDDVSTYSASALHFG